MTKTFHRWRREITDWEERKAREAQVRRRYYRRQSNDKRRRAVQAFWAMHVEAWQWSGLPLRDYSSALRLSPYSLKRWRNMIEAEEVVIDWRTLLHPSARPLISTKISTRTKEAERIQTLTAQIEAAAGTPERARRRRFSTEQKIALLLEAERHGETISSVCRRHGISTSVLFRWRDQFGLGREKPTRLVPVRVIEGRAQSGASEASLLAGLLPCPEGMKEVELADGRRVFAPVEADPDDVRRTVAEREMRP
ncbi:transposase [Altererythrobacter sp. N1]|nr:transposase [Altererythrobacter sp. N1]